jgi:2-desacetyl-2-hydroxyethyl bacteriochlorophyllide A dehydrogenase
VRVIELVAPGHLQLAERETPVPGPGEVRIAVSLAGICGTDMEFYAGRRSAGTPFILGHECSGQIDAVGPGVADWETETAVTVRPNFGCGTCAFCEQERDNICPNGRGLGVTIDGCLAEFIVAPARYVWRVPDGMNLETAALIEPTAVAERAVRQAGPIAGCRVLILGAGTIGLLALQAAVRAGADVTIVDPMPERRRWAMELGASSAVEPSCGAGEPREFDVVIETAGVAQTVPVAVERVRPGGRVVLTGIPMDDASVGTRWIVWRELEVVGSFIYESSDFARASDRLASGEIRALDLVTGRYPIDRAAEAFESVSRHEGMKVLIRMSEEES